MPQLQAVPFSIHERIRSVLGILPRIRVLASAQADSLGWVSAVVVHASLTDSVATGEVSQTVGAANRQLVVDLQTFARQVGQPPMH